MKRRNRMSEETRARLAEAMRARWMQPAFKEHHSARMKALNADPAFRAKRSATMKALHARPGFTARLAAGARERMKAMNADPAFRARLSAAMKARNADPEFRERLRRAHHNRTLGLSVRQLKTYWALRDRGMDQRSAFHQALRPDQSQASIEPTSEAA